MKALQKMREPDELDAPTLLAAPRGWIAVFVVMIMMAGVVIWGFLGRLPLTRSATGLLTHPLGISSVQTPYGGVVHDVLVTAGQTVQAKQNLAVVTDATGLAHNVTSPFRGTVVGVSISGGEVISVGTPVMSVERTDGPDDRLVAMLFLPADEATGIAPGEAVVLAVSSAPAAAFGLLRGRVVTVSKFPLTSQALNGLLGDPLAVQTYAPHGAPRMVLVDLVPDRTTVSGFAWTTRNGPPTALQSHVTVAGTISLGGRSPVSFVLGR
jgi:hypothetical protein